VLETDRILLTGITGSLGSWIAGEMLKRGLRILALVRDKTASAAEARVKSVLDIVGAGDLQRNVDIVRGDICENRLGIDDRNGVFDGICAVFHCAASTEFPDSNAELSQRVNVEGTANVLELAGSLRIPVCHISTAYIAGRRRGVVTEEETDVGQSFNNVYERTKCQAEVLVHRWALEMDLPAMVFRPSIVIGDSKNGRIARFNGMYNLLRFFDAAAPAIRNEPIRVVAKPQATKNFIPVDYLAKAVWQIVDHGVAGTYHLTNPQPLTLAPLRDIYSSLFDINGKLVDEDDFRQKRATRSELLFKRANALYQPYLAEEPVFDRTNTDAVLDRTGVTAPIIDSAYFARLLEYARSVQWGKYQAEQPEISDSSRALVERYFGEFLASKMHKRLLPDLRRLSASFRIIVKGWPQMSWSLAIEHGVLTSISRNGTVCQCSFIVDSDTFEQLTSGRLAPQQAFFKKRIDIKGSIETGLKLAPVLAVFFRKFPYEVESA
jgi:thioester reductase-like protein